MHRACAQSLSHIQPLGAPWTVARQAPLSMGFSWQEHWSRLPCPSPGDLPNPKIEAASPALAGRFFTSEPPGKPILCRAVCIRQSQSHSLFLPVSALVAVSLLSTSVTLFLFCE